LEAVTSTLDSFELQRLRASADMSRLRQIQRRKKADLLAAAPKQRSEEAALNIVAWSLEHLSGSGSALRATGGVERHDALLERVLAPAIQRSVGDWVTLKTLELELGADVQALLSGERHGSANELGLLSHALNELVVASQRDVDAVAGQLAARRSEMQATVAESATLLSDVSTLEAAIASVDHAAEELAARQTSAYRHAINKLLAQSAQQRAADHRPTFDAGFRLLQAQDAAADYESAAHGRFLSDPIHRRIAALSEALIAPSVAAFAETVASRSDSRPRASRNTNRHSHQADAGAVLAAGDGGLVALDRLDIICDAPVRNTIRRRREAQTNAALSPRCEEDFLVVRDKVDGSLRIVQVLAADRRRQHGVSATTLPDGSASFLVDRSSAQGLGPLSITVEQQ
jgi:hypothetical protein